MCVSDVLEFRTATLRLNWVFFPLFFSSLSTAPKQEPSHCLGCWMRFGQQKPESGY